MPATVPPVENEREGLTAFLAYQRQALRNAAYGLTDEQARLTPTASSLSVGGLIKHVARVEHTWMDMVERLPRQGDPNAYAEGFVFGPDDTLEGVLADHRRAAERTDRVVAGIDDLGYPVPIPKGVPWFPQDADAWSLRWVLLHLIHETARHAGHADIVRESVDGATAFPLMAAAEGRPETPWLTPWRPENPA
ncbi:DinB family protein [Actinomadura logoneensis]|uniref:DinB family protein n=1 Tax=Actinomadura logoneensis TaxID=2293572 RepID=A0A372JFM4_9ACTN|nr:DinB family protein [Actinomadura logoneensis]RFU38699.1 DinB family protein [Actinomadura logoneensis]